MEACCVAPQKSLCGRMCAHIAKYCDRCGCGIALLREKPLVVQLVPLLVAEKPDKELPEGKQ